MTTKEEKELSFQNLADKGGSALAHTLDVLTGKAKGLGVADSASPAGRGSQVSAVPFPRPWAPWAACLTGRRVPRGQWHGVGGCARGCIGLWGVLRGSRAEFGVDPFVQ